MTSVNDYHNMAMEFADLGLSKRARGEHQRALAYFEQALDFELAAIAALDRSGGLGWSILHRSAGTLALDCQRFRQAEQITARALAGEPHPDIADELRDVFEQSNFHRRLSWNDVAIGQWEIRMNLVGRAAGSDVTNLACLLPRMESMQSLIHRTTQRLLELPYRARVPKHIREHYPIFASAPPSGSFAISLRLGHPAAALPGLLGPARVIGEFIDLMAMVNDGDMDSVERRIPDPAYRNNFVGLARRVAPDGDDIRQVGFAANVGEDIRTVAFTRSSSQICPPDTADSPDASDWIEIAGMLGYADVGSHNGKRFKIIDARGQMHDIQAPSGMMDDIVRPMWNSSVTVVGTRRPRQKIIRLYDIRPSESAARSRARAT